MEPPHALLVTDKNSEITATVRRETSRLAAFIKRRVRDVGDAEDILQDVFHEFVRAYRLPEPIEQAGSWLFRVARNRIIDRYRKRTEAPGTALTSDLGDDEFAERLDVSLPAFDSGPEGALARSMLLETMEHALDELPMEQRAVFVAHEVEGLSFKEIASRTGVPVNTLLSRKRYAVLHLRARLQPIYDELES
jgi:RNA polymerase sigma factor (sigma-70 family)